MINSPLRTSLQAGAHPYGKDELEAVATQGVATFLSRYGPEDMDRREGSSVQQDHAEDDDPSPPKSADAERLSGMPQPIRVIRQADLVDSDPTSGMRRQVAIDVPGLWSGVVHTEPGALSGWHHHGNHETSLYVVSGSMRLEFGRGGRSVVDAGPGDFIHVPAGVVHRESNPADQPSSAVIARAGTGEPTVNVDGPNGD